MTDGRYRFGDGVTEPLTGAAPATLQPPTQVKFVAQQPGRYEQNWPTGQSVLLVQGWQV